MGVVAAVERDLKGMGSEASESALAATALALAAELDDPENSATSKSMCAKALNETMAQLRALAPRKDVGPVDELRDRRNRRRRSSAS